MTLHQAFLYGLVRGVVAAVLLLSCPLGWHLGQAAANATAKAPEGIFLNLR